MERHSAIYPTSQPTYDTDGTVRELELLDTLQDFDCLLSYCLGPARYTRTVITRLMKGHYIGLLLGNDEHGLSQDAREYARHRNVFYPLTVWPRGEALLARRGLWRDRKKQSDHFDHKVSRCLYEFSLHRGAKQYGATLDGLDGILSDPRCPWKPTKEDKHAHRIPVGKEHIIPDLTFRVRLNKTFCAHVEIDKGTEDLNSASADSIVSKLRRYAKYIDGRGFNKRYGLPNITIIFVFDKLSRHAAFPELVKKVCPNIAGRFASMYVPDFRKEYPPLTGYALEDDYERMGGPLNILKLIGDNRERTESRTNIRADERPEEDRRGAIEAVGG